MCSKYKKIFLQHNIEKFKNFKLHFVCVCGGRSLGVQVPCVCVCVGQRTTMCVGQRTTMQVLGWISGHQAWNVIGL